MGDEEWRSGLADVGDRIGLLALFRDFFDRLSEEEWSGIACQAPCDYPHLLPLPVPRRIAPS
jgi:hypothetical protein